MHEIGEVGDVRDVDEEMQEVSPEERRDETDHEWRDFEPELSLPPRTWSPIVICACLSCHLLAVILILIPLSGIISFVLR